MDTKDIIASDTDAPLLVYENIDTSDFLASFKIDDNFKLVFNKQVMAGNGDIVISNGTDTRIVAIDDANQVVFDELGGVTIDLAEDLVADTTYQVQMSSGVIIDAEGNPFAGFDISGTQTKTSGPTFLSGNVRDGSVFKTDGKIELNFDEKVIAGSGDIIFSNGIETLTIPVTDVNQVIFDESESHAYGSVIIDPKNDLTADSTYTVQFGEGMITDSAGNPFKGFGDISLTTIGSAPLLLASSPSNGAQTKADGEIILLFDEKVIAGSGDIVFSNGTDTRIIAIDDTSQVSFDESGRVTIDLPDDLVVDTRYNVQMANGVITDINGDPYSGFSDASFIPTTYSGPILLGIDHFSSAIDHDITELIFDKQVIAGHGDIIMSGSTIVRDEGGFFLIRKDTVIIPVTDTNQVIFDKTNSDELGSVIIDPHKGLVDHFEIVLLGNGVITDAEGNAFPGNAFSSSTHSAAITSGPILLASSPTNDSQIKVDDGIKLFFDEKVIAGSGDIVFSNGTDTRIVPISDTSQVGFDESGGVTIDLAEDLVAGTTYQAQMASGVITDTIGNSYSGFNDAKISVINSTPLLLASNPADGSKIKTDDEIKLFFDEKVIAGSGDIVFSNGADIRVVPVSDTNQVSFDEFGGVAIDLSEDLIASATYQVQMANGVITDTAGNTYAGFSNAVIETAESNPLLQSAGFIDDKIDLLFDEQVGPGNGDIFISNGTDTRIISMNDSSQVIFDEHGGVAVDPIEALSKNSVYGIKIETGAIVDMEDNPYTGALFNSSPIPLFEYISYESVLGEFFGSSSILVG